MQRLTKPNITDNMSKVCDVMGDYRLDIDHYTCMVAIALYRHRVVVKTSVLKFQWNIWLQRSIFSPSPSVQTSMRIHSVKSMAFRLLAYLKHVTLELQIFLCLLRICIWQLFSAGVSRMQHSHIAYLVVLVRNIWNSICLATQIATHIRRFLNTHIPCKHLVYSAHWFPYMESF